MKETYICFLRSIPSLSVYVTPLLVCSDCYCLWCCLHLNRYVRSCSILWLPLATLGILLRAWMDDDSSSSDDTSSSMDRQQQQAPSSSATSLSSEVGSNEQQTAASSSSLNVAGFGGACIACRNSKVGYQYHCCYYATTRTSSERVRKQAQEASP